MKAACLTLAIIVIIAILAVSVMVKFATDITVEERKREIPDLGVEVFGETLTVKTLNENINLVIAERFPYVAAIARNSSASWSFACFASVLLVKWVVTSAHCRVIAKDHVTHRVLILNDFALNSTRTFPILFWRIHENYLPNSTLYDIAVAKFNIDYSFTFKLSTFDNTKVWYLDACIWKTVSAMDKKIYLLNDFDEFHFRVAPPVKCYEAFGIAIQENQICADMSNYEDCFVNEFGPIYAGDKLAGVLSFQPRDCEVKYAIFTNVSYFAMWISRVTRMGPF